LRKQLRGLKEFTIEANPDSLDSEKLSIFLENGINRISIGAQSFNDDKLKLLGRRHDAQQAKNCVQLALKEGFKNISVDMIFGVRGETLKSWKNDLETAANLPLKHISAYSLTHEKELSPVDDDTMAEMYRHTISYLKSTGFDQ
jgi:oxygen-independent coproporphyrinogen III oxidase